MLKIALSGSMTSDIEGYNLAYANNAYVQAFYDLQAQPMIIPFLNLSSEPATFQPQTCISADVRNFAKAALAESDALLLTGGHDLDPRFYGEEAHAKLGKTLISRDVFDFALLAEAITRKMPILAICRGLQLINVYFGGTLYQDLSERQGTTLGHVQKSSSDQTWHSVKIAHESLLAKICQIENLQVNSLHHQAVKDLALNLEALAWAPDGLIEAFTLPNYPFLLAVQWHHEFLQREQATMRDLFIAFLKAAAQYQANK